MGCTGLATPHKSVWLDNRHGGGREELGSPGAGRKSAGVSRVLLLRVIYECRGSQVPHSETITSLLAASLLRLHSWATRWPLPHFCLFLVTATWGEEASSQLVQ